MPFCRAGYMAWLSKPCGISHSLASSVLTGRGAPPLLKFQSSEDIWIEVPNIHVVGISGGGEELGVEGILDVCVDART